MNNSELTRALGIELPIVQAPMAGGITTPELVAAVSNAGALGCLGAGYMSASAIRQACRRIRELTRSPFCVNLFVPEPDTPDPAEVVAANRALAPYRRALGIAEEPALPTAFAEPFEDQLEAVVAERVPVFSFTFGIPTPAQLSAVRAAGSRIIGTATTWEEACLLAAAGVDATVAQGAEAGGHRGTFAAPFEKSLVGTLPLVRQIKQATAGPVLAAGGIMDGQSVASALGVGAEAAVLGTAFLVAEEAGTHPAAKAALLLAKDEDTRLTRAFSGKPARGISNAFMRKMDEAGALVAPYPAQNALTRGLRAAAAAAGDAEFMSVWAGQGAGATRPMPAATLVTTLADEMVAALAKV